MKPRWNRGALRHLAAKYRGRKVGLYGGSFNPAHQGHIYIATEALKRIKLDEVWFLVSPGNPLKEEKGMAPFTARFNRLEGMVQNHAMLKASDLENTLGTRYSADTIDALVSELPHTHFVWIMGADNLACFDLWHRWRDIADTLPIAVFDRSGYSLDGFASGLARCYKKYRTPANRFRASQIPNWTFVTLPRHPASATEIRNREGENWFRGRTGKDT